MLGISSSWLKHNEISQPYHILSPTTCTTLNSENMNTCDTYKLVEGKKERILKQHDVHNGYIHCKYNLPHWELVVQTNLLGSLRILFPISSRWHNNLRQRSMTQRTVLTWDSILQHHLILYMVHSWHAEMYQAETDLFQHHSIYGASFYIWCIRGMYIIIYKCINLRLHSTL